MSEEKQIKSTKKCPFCKEEITGDAIKCKNCGSDLRSWFRRHRIISAYLILSLIVTMILSISMGISSVLAFLFLANLILLGLGLINPSVVKMASRKSVIKKLGLSFFVLFFLLCLTTPSASNSVAPVVTNDGTNQNSVNQSQPQNNQTIATSSEQSVATSEKEKTYQQVFAFSGNGAKKSEPFTITGDRFKIKYDCSGDFCQAFLKSTKNEYDVKIIMNSVSAIKDETINYGAGEYYLESNCIGNYSMTVEDYK